VRRPDFHFHGFDESEVVAVADIGTGLNGECADAPGDFGDNFDLWHANGFLL